MMLTSFDADIIFLFLKEMDVLDKMNFASCSSETRGVCSPLYQMWDKELAHLVSKWMEDEFEDYEFVMASPSPLSEEMRKVAYPTSGMSRNPDFVLKKGTSRVVHFEVFPFRANRVTYSLQPVNNGATLSRIFGGKEVVQAVPELEDFQPIPVWTRSRPLPSKLLSSFPSFKAAWRLHPDLTEKDAYYSYGGPHETDKVVYVRSHNIVSLDVWVHSRIKIEMMGTAYLPTYCYYESLQGDSPSKVLLNKGGQVKMTQARVYVEPRKAFYSS